jgi:hypothetical protein
MHLRVFLVANPFRLRTRRTRDIWCLKPRGLHQLHILMIFGDGTHSKRRPWLCTLDFYTKIQVWGDGESPRFHTHQKPSCLKNDVSSPCWKKELKIIMKKENEKKRRERRNHKMGSPLLNLVLSPRPMVHKHYLCVWPSLGICLSWTTCDHAPIAATSSFIHICCR